MCLHFFTIIFLVNLAFCCANSVLTQNSSEFWDENEPFGIAGSEAADLRLPTEVVPSYYRLKIKAHLQNSTFTGDVAITIRANKRVKEIILHSKDLKINDNAKLTEQIYEKVQLYSGRTKRALNADGKAKLNPDSAESQEIKDNLSSENGNNNKTNNINATNSDANTTLSVKSETTTKAPVTTSEQPIQTEKITEGTTKDITTDFPSNETFTIPNDETIIVEIPKPINEVSLSNMRNIKIINIAQGSGDRLILTLASALKTGVDYTLELSFEGVISDSLTGFYKSSYTNSKQEVRTIAVTQFEPTMARAAFPCFDEPQLKAQVELSLAHDKRLTALSNTRVATEEDFPDGQYQWTHFERTPPLSTYLVAYCLSDFRSLQTEYLSTDNVTKPIRVWARAEHIDKAQYALTITKKLLEFYEELFSIPYALDKLDLVAIPDFSSGAMENWGLITFRETALLYDQSTVTPRAQQGVCVDAAHELAHQWLGDLATARWWGALWLNEGLASYMEYVGVHHIEPEWKMFESFSRDKMDLLRLDSLKNTSPVSREVVDASEISQKFDEISYSKGANLIRMLNYTVGGKVFRDGLVKYLNKWKYSSAEENDLWAAMDAAVEEAASGKSLGVDNRGSKSLENENGESKSSEVDDKQMKSSGVRNEGSKFSGFSDAGSKSPGVGVGSVGSFMSSWTRQAGYPVLRARRDYSAGKVNFEQSLFTTSKSPYKSMLEQIWQIPITYKAIGSNQTEPILWLKEHSGSFSVNVREGDALYVNVDAIGYYRVNYDSRNWELLRDALKKSRIKSPVARAQLLDDAFNLAKVGQLDYSYALDMATYMMDGEDSKIVWDTLLNNMAFLRHILKTTSAYVYFQDFMKLLLAKQLKTLNYGLTKPKDDNEAFLIEDLLSWECAVEAQRCIDWAKGQFDSWAGQKDLSNNTIPSYLRHLVYSTALRRGGRKEFELLWGMFQNTTDPSVKSLIINSLPSTTEEGLITMLLEKSLTEIPKQYSASVWNFDSTVGCKLAQDFFIENWDRVYQVFSQTDAFLFPGVLSGAFGAITSEDELEKLKVFATRHRALLRPLSQTIQKLVDAGGLRAAWRRQRAPAVRDWLEKYLADKSSQPLQVTPSKTNSTIPKITLNINTSGVNNNTGEVIAGNTTRPVFETGNPKNESSLPTTTMLPTNETKKPNEL